MLAPLLAKTWFAVPTEVGKIKVYDWPAEWAGDCILTPWEFCSQLSCNVPPLVFPFISTTPVPFGANNKSLFESVTISFSLVSKLPPNCGVVSAAIEVNPVETFTQAEPL